MFIYREERSVVFEVYFYRVYLECFDIIVGFIRNGIIREVCRFKFVVRFYGGCC